jgi:glutathione S-transferase
MKLYTFPRAPNPRRVGIFLAEKGVEVPRTTVNLGEMEHSSAAFAEINPLQRVPVLELDDGTRIAESIAICRYLEELHPDPPLFGTDARDRALVEMWQRHAELHLFQPVTFVFRHLHPAMAKMEVPQVPEWGEANKPRVMKTLEWLDAELGKRAFIAGTDYSVADITVLVALDFMKPAKLAVPEDLFNLARWREAVAGRPAIEATKVA